MKLHIYHTCEIEEAHIDMKHLTCIYGKNDTQIDIIMKAFTFFTKIPTYIQDVLGFSMNIEDNQLANINKSLLVLFNKVFSYVPLNVGMKMKFEYTPDRYIVVWIDRGGIRNIMISEKIYDDLINEDYIFEHAFYGIQCNKNTAIYFPENRGFIYDHANMLSKLNQSQFSYLERSFITMIDDQGGTHAPGYVKWSSDMEDDIFSHPPKEVGDEIFPSENCDYHINIEFTPYIHRMIKTNGGHLSYGESHIEWIKELYKAIEEDRDDHYAINPSYFIIPNIDMGLNDDQIVYLCLLIAMMARRGYYVIFSTNNSFMHNYLYYLTIPIEEMEDGCLEYNSQFKAANERLNYKYWLNRNKDISYWDISFPLNNIQLDREDMNHFTIESLIYKLQCAIKENIEVNGPTHIVDAIRRGDKI